MTNANDAAFVFDANEDGTLNPLTKREYFAAMAMQGTLATANGEYGYTDSYTPLLDATGKHQYDEDGETLRKVTLTAEQKYARDAVQYADALIAALNADK